jgi:hypothetical protein
VGIHIWLDICGYSCMVRHMWLFICGQSYFDKPLGSANDLSTDARVKTVVGADAASESVEPLSKGCFLCFLPLEFLPELLPEFLSEFLTEFLPEFLGFFLGVLAALALAALALALLVDLRFVFAPFLFFLWVVAALALALLVDLRFAVVAVSATPPVGTCRTDPRGGVICD